MSFSDSLYPSVSTEMNATLSPDLDNWIHAFNPIVSMSRDYPVGHTISMHRHPRGQLVYASKGVMELQTCSECWVLPPLRGVWIPAGTEHQMMAKTALSLCTLYVRINELHQDLPLLPFGVAVSPLLRELLAKAETIPLNYPPAGFEERLLSLALEEMVRSVESGLKLPMPRDKRLSRICSDLLKNPGDLRSLAEWGNYVGATSRTLTRLFHTETGLSFSVWREQLRIIDAIPRLIKGEQIGRVADSLGYQSQASFTVMFKRVTGKVPSDYRRRK